MVLPSSSTIPTQPSGDQIHPPGAEPSYRVSGCRICGYVTLTITVVVLLSILAVSVVIITKLYPIKYFILPARVVIGALIFVTAGALAMPFISCGTYCLCAQDKYTQTS